MEILRELFGMEDNWASNLIIIKGMMVAGVVIVLISVRRWIMRPGRTKTKEEYDRINTI